MTQWLYKQPVTIIFGEGKIKELDSLCEKLGGTKGILISTPFCVRNGQAKTIQDNSKGKITHIFSELSPNPDVTETDACAKTITDNGIDFVVALGGGSALDLAKAAASVCLTGESITKYHGTGVAIPEEHLPLIAIPTTAGTASEVTGVSVLTDHKSGKKAPIVSAGFYPDYALIDPELTYTMPPYLTACTGLDVLAHALEGYWSTGHQPICDTVAIEACDLVFKYLPRAYADGQDKEAREQMCLASVLAGLCFTLTKTTSSHACSYPLTNIYDIPHGEACALTLDFFARANKSDPRVESIAKKLGYSSVDSLADGILDLKKTLKVRTDMKEFNLNEEKLAELVKLSQHPNMLNNPIEITEEKLYEMYRGMM